MAPLYAQGQTNRYHVIAFERSFHGRTLGSLAATGQAGYREGFGPLTGVTHVPYGDVDAVAARLDDNVAAVLVEPVQGEGGVLPAPQGFLESCAASPARAEPCCSGTKFRPAWAAPGASSVSSTPR